MCLHELLSRCAHSTIPCNSHAGAELPHYLANVAVSKAKGKGTFRGPGEGRRRRAEGTARGPSKGRRHRAKGTARGPSKGRMLRQEGTFGGPEGKGQKGKSRVKGRS